MCSPRLLVYPAEAVPRAEQTRLACRKRALLYRFRQSAQLRAHVAHHPHKGQAAAGLHSEQVPTPKDKCDHCASVCEPPQGVGNLRISKNDSLIVGHYLTKVDLAVEF
jgi:hypothetical protein